MTFLRLTPWINSRAMEIWFNDDIPFEKAQEQAMKEYDSL